MARRPRHFLSGATYHVMLRGNNGQQIFSSNEERCRFCLLIQEGVERYGHSILAFCFMTNHVHLAIQVNEIPLSKICQNLAFRYTRFYNQRHGTIGHLFQGRFKSILVGGNHYLKELIRYIHLNPIRAKIVGDPLHYRWSSYQAYLMQQKFTWLATEIVLKLFGTSPQESIDAFHLFITSGIGQCSDIDFKKGISEGILGDDTFIEKMRDESNHRNNGLLLIDLKTLVSVITDYYEINVEMLKTSKIERKTSHIRAVMALLVRDSKGMSLRELADFLYRTDSSMSQAAARLEARMYTSEIIRSEVNHLKAKFLEVANKNYDQFSLTVC